MPPPAHLALLLTLAAHPAYTTRARSADRRRAARLALRYLHLLAALAGPRASGLGADAWAFPGASPAAATRDRRRQQRRHGAFDDVADEGLDRREELEVRLAREDSLFARAGDVWRAVGWALNCSVAHRARWEGAWRAWLALVVRVLEDDWRARAAAGHDAGDSLLARYVTGGRGREGGDGAAARRILRAVFADGSAGSAAEFGALWRHETKVKKERSVEEEMERARAKRAQAAPATLDLDAGDYGDYRPSDDEDSSASGSGDDATKASTDDRPRRSARPRSPVKADPATDGAADAPADDATRALGGPAALGLRWRLVALLANLAGARPDAFVPFGALAELCAAHLRPLPLRAFAAALAPGALCPPLAPAPAAGLLQTLLRALLEPGAHAALLDAGAAATPGGSRIGGGGGGDDGLAQDVLERAYLPWAASTAGLADNAKAGACVEALLRLFARAAGLAWSEGLARAAEEGVRRREEKATRVGGRRGEAGTGSAGEADRAWLRLSGLRVRAVVAAARPAG